MSSMVSMILNKGWSKTMAPGRVVRFGDDWDKELTEGSLRKRVLHCLRSKRTPLDVEHIAEVINDKPFRVNQILRQLLADGLIREIGSGYNQRFHAV